MKVGLAVFMVVVFLAQNAQSGVYEAGNYAYKRLNANETQYFLNSLNTLSDGAVGGLGMGQQAIQGLNLELLSAQISEHIRTAVEPLLLHEASIISNISPLFTAHQSSNNILIYSFVLGVLALLLIDRQKLMFKDGQFMRLKKSLVSISPRSPNSVI
ncbi:MAG: hypothetical protein WCQ00_02100 [bacterium]